jgi:hypothetical protein
MAVRIVSAVVGLVAIVGMLAFDPLVRSLALDRAEREGVELTLGHVDPGFGRVALRRFSFQLEGVSRFFGEVDRLDVELDGLDPTAIEVRGARLESWGAPAELVLALGTWAALYPTLWTLPLGARDVSSSWRPAVDAEPWLVLRAGVARADGSGAGELDGTLRVAGVELGAVALGWTARDARLALGWGTANPATLKLGLDWSGPLALTATLAESTLEELLGPFGGSVPARGVRLSGRLGAELTGVGAPLVGTAELTLSGYQPPLPAEVRAIAFGTTTELSSRLRAALDPPELLLEELKVTHGSLVLTGQGRVAESNGAPRAWLTLAGELPCTELARTAVRDRLGGPFGQLVGGLAGRAVGGTVRVVVEIEADPRRLHEATVTPSITVGCDLRPGRLLPALLPREAGR